MFDIGSSLMNGFICEFVSFFISKDAGVARNLYYFYDKIFFFVLIILGLIYFSANHIYFEWTLNTHNYTKRLTESYGFFTFLFLIKLWDWIKAFALSEIY